jgi:hypothetical protein
MYLITLMFAATNINSFMTSSSGCGGGHSSSASFSYSAIPSAVLHS